MQPIERHNTMTRAARTWRRWTLIALMIAWIYLASSVLQGVASIALNFTLLGVFLAVTEVLTGISIAAGEVLPFALGLVFFGTLLSNIPFFHLQLVNVPPDHWKIAVALAGCAMLIGSRWINEVIEHLPLLREFKTSNTGISHSIPNPSDHKIEITVRVAHRGFSIFPRRRRVRRSNASHVDEKIVHASGGSEMRYDRHDHKVPFWVR